MHKKAPLQVLDLKRYECDWTITSQDVRSIVFQSVLKDLPLGGSA